MNEFIVHIIPFVAAGQTALDRFGSSWPWFAIRASGFLAIILLVGLMLSGIGQVTGMTYRFIEPLKAWTIHKAMGIALCVSILLHVSLLLVDKFMKFSLSEIFVPFINEYSNKADLFGMSFDTVAVASGIFAMYGSFIIVASSLGWIDTKKGAWKVLHYLSYIVIVLALIHGITTGTDLVEGPLRWVWLAATLLIFGAIGARLLRTGTLKK